MASASDWWQRRFASPTSPPTAPPGTPAAPYGARPAPGPEPPQVGYLSYDARTGAQVADDGTMAALVGAAEATGGSKRVRENTGTCPECGSGNFFSRRYTEGGMPMRMEAAPRCYDCGFPIIQAGSSRGSASSVRATGPAQRARQLPAGHEVTVLDGSSQVTYRAS